MDFSDFRRRCKQYQDGNDESVKTFRGAKEVSILSANETEKPFMKLEKDNNSLQAIQTPEALPNHA